MNVCQIDIPIDGRMGKWRIYPIGDLHSDSKLFDEEKFRRYTEVIAADENAMWISVGDYVDGSTPDHKYFEPGVMIPEAFQNLGRYHDFCFERLQDLLGTLPPSRGVMLEGNHDTRAGLAWSGFTPALARKLGVKFLGYEGMVRAQTRFRAGAQGVKLSSYLIHAHHGHGAGSKPGSKMNRMIDMTLALADADVYIQGHLEDAMARVVPIYSVSREGSLRLKANHRAWVRAAGFYGGRVEGVINYASKKGLPSLDAGVFYLELHKNDAGEVRIVRREFI